MMCGVCGVRGEGEVDDMCGVSQMRCVVCVK